MLSAEGSEGPQEQGASQHPASSAYALILAAGQARRFGADKLLALLGGRPVLEPVLERVVEAEQHGLIAGSAAVLPAGNAELSRLVRRYGCTVVENETPAHGLCHSLRLGLARLSSPDFTRSARAALILLGDQPTVRLAALEAVVAAWRETRSGFIRLRYAEHPRQPGHPVLLDRSLWPMAERLEGDAGFGSVLHAHPELCLTLDFPGLNPDVDTVDDLRRIEERN